MAADSMLNRINKIDFLAVLPPGCYSVMMITFLFVVPSDSKSITEVIKPIADSLKANPVYWVFLLFSAYLIGSIFRTLRVKWAERLYPRQFRSNFPCKDVLKDALAKLSGSLAVKLDVSKLPDLTGGLSNDDFNYWKDMLCIDSEHGFHYHETFEARSRFSAGMVWAGIAGFVSGLVMIAQSGHIAWQMMLISLIIYVAFGIQLKRVRQQEAKALFFLYIAETQH